MSNVIEFEGKSVTPNAQGYYKCPFNCGDKRYPAKKWKTHAGFSKHTQECPNRPSIIKAKEIANDQLWAVAKEKIDEVLTNFPYKVGDVVHYVKETTIKPEYEQRGTRQVRVRYEPVNKYEALSTTITSIDLHPTQSLYYNTTAEYIKNNLILINKGIKISQICSDKESAEKKAKERQQNHDDWREFSSMVR